MNKKKDNLQARSQILDTDFAFQTTQLANKQIVTETAIAIVSTANQQPSIVLQLLKYELKKTLAAKIRIFSCYLCNPL